MTHLNLVIPVILALLLTACLGDGNAIPNDTTTTDPGGRPATVRIGSLGSPDSLNPGVGQLAEANDIFRLVYDSLYQLQSGGSYTLELAERADVSEDGLGWTFKLRDGITFHDGVLLTAEDVAFTFSLYQNTEDFPGLADSVNSFASVDAPDERTVFLTLNEPVPNLQSKLIELYVLPKPIWSKLEHPADFENPAKIGSGPFKLKEFRQSEFVDLQAEGARAYRLEHTGINYILWQRQYSGDWEQNYRFTLEPRQYADFEPMCHYHQTSPHSLFTHQRLCTKATPEGRITLDQTRLITTIHGQRQERTLLGEDEFWALARLHFDIEVTV